MPKALNLVGKRFGNLVVVNKCDHKSNSGKVLWLCKCDCGGTIETATGNLTKGITTHCKECILKRKSTKYDRRTPAPQAHGFNRGLGAANK